MPLSWAATNASANGMAMSNIFARGIRPGAAGFNPRGHPRRLKPAAQGLEFVRP